MKKLFPFFLVFCLSTSIFAQSVSNYRRAANQGDVLAQNNLATCYYYGQGVTQDYTQAVYWYRKAAEQGDSMAQSHLGYCYYNGQGVAKDYSQAVYWYNRAAEQGHVLAQNILGSCYYYGQGVTQDYSQAAHWYSRAAEQGNTWAQTNLATCYYQGTGVSKDDNSALYWYERALENGNGNLSEHALTSAIARINELRTGITGQFTPPSQNEQVYQSNLVIDPVYEEPVKKENASPVHKYDETTVMIAPAEVNFPQGVNTMVQDGYIGDYVTAALMEQLLKSNKIQLIDRSILDIQRNEINMGQSGEIDYSTMLQYGKITGVKYIVKVTMQKPDVVNARNNIPVGAFLGVAQNAAYISGGNSGQQLSQQFQQTRQVTPENVSTEKVKVSVNMIATVLDLQTGRVLFMSKSVGKASGKPQVGIDLPTAQTYDPYGYGYSQPQTGKLELNQGAFFTQTITGQAIEDAFKKIGPELVGYFNRQIKSYEK